MTKLRLSAETKTTIAHQVAREWTKFAREILADGGKPAKLSATACCEKLESETTGEK